MREIRIENFISIKEGVYAPKSFNVVIGEQASGKSLLVKLDYLFQEAVSNILLDSIFNQEGRKEFFANRIEEKFSKYFDDSVYSTSSFKIDFHFKTRGDKRLSVILEKSKRGRVKVYIGEELNELRKFLLKEFRKKINNLEDINSQYIRSFKKRIFEEFPDIFSGHVFVPAGRSYFVNMDRILYFLLEGNYRIDPFLISFGTYYESIKDFFKADNVKEEVKTKFLRHETVGHKIYEVLKGELAFSKERKNFGIKKDQVFYEIFSTSSGQQEIIPLLLVVISHLHKKEAKSKLYIEEPEAHLFPFSQKAILEVLAILPKFGHEVALTTHSPYIITALNNLLVAGEKEEYLNEDEKKYALHLDEVQAYAFENGRLHSIIDSETGLIDGYTIDQVSEIFAQEFERYMNLG